MQNIASVILQRQQKLITSLKQSDFDAIALNASPSQKYYSGLDFHLMERPIVLLILSNGEIGIILPEFEKGKLEGIDFEVSAFTYNENPSEWQDVFSKALDQLVLQDARIGIEDTSLRFLELEFLQVAAPKSRFLKASSILTAGRERKDAVEIKAMQKAATIAEAALSATLPFIKIGLNEKEIAARLVQELLSHGSDAELPFFPIIASGPNSANPHASISERQIKKGDLLLFDWGACVDGYFSDMTRTFAIGKIDDELKKVHALVVAATEAGKKMVAPGNACQDIDRAARKVIEDANYGEFFQTRTGHGLGMEVHEEPYIREGNLKKLESGMTFTVEPGIYIPGRGGVRIEDDVLVTEEGMRSFTSFPRDLQIIA